MSRRAIAFTAVVSLVALATMPLYAQNPVGNPRCPNCNCDVALARASLVAAAALRPPARVLTFDQRRKHADRPYVTDKVLAESEQLLDETMARLVRPEEE